MNTNEHKWVGWRAGALVAGLGFLLGQAGGDTELDRLRDENARLRGEIAELRKELGELKGGGRGGIAASGPATTRAVVRTFTTMGDILAKLPAELQPKAGQEWRMFTEGKLDSWWTNQLVGMRFEQVMSLASANVGKNPNGMPGGEWIVSNISFGQKEFTAMGQGHAWAIGSMRLEGDEAFARKWMNFKRGTLFKIKGVIDGADFAGQR